MSSPSASVQSIDSHNNPRRRQRDSEDGVSFRQQPKRKRNKLSRDVFVPLEDAALVNGNDETRKLMNGHATSAAQSERASSLQPVVMPYRGNPKSVSAKMGLRDDGTTTLTKNSNYTVKQLPSLPKLVRSAKMNYRGCRINSAGYALVLTRDQALVWDYTTSAPVPTTQTLVLPNPAKMDDPLPVGAFVTSESGGDTGLVVVNATTGKVALWESIENADALSLFEQRRNGVEGSCGSLMYGETVTDIEDASSAGFIITFSTGRAAQLLVKDANSRSSITVNFLRNNKSTSGGGFLGGLRNVFGGAGWIRSVVAARTRPGISRGHTEAIIASEEATFQIWQLNWSGQTVLQKEIDARPVIEEAIGGIHSADFQSQALGVNVVDFAIASATSERLDILVLVNFGPASTQSFALINIEIEDNDIPAARRTILLHSYNALLISKSNWKPKLCLPHPGSTAFVVFEKAIVLVSLALETSSPISQFLIDAGQFPEPYQDAVCFRDESDYISCGAMTESHTERTRDPAILIFVKNFGMIRMTASSYSSDMQTLERMRVTAKSKIEQAVFFGAQASNPLSLARKPQNKFPIEEVETAALNISRDILATDSPCLTAVAPSMELHLEQRAQNLKDLASHLKLFYPDLSRETKWSLCMDAEKMAAARKVWSVYDARRKKGNRDLRLLPEMIISIHEEHKTEMDMERGETDPTRHFFLKDVSKMDLIIGWPYNQLEMSNSSGYIRDSYQYLEVLSEANDIFIGGLSTAFNYRSKNLELYGLEQEPVDEGLLLREYEGLPEFWTSTPVIWLKLPEHIRKNQEKILEFKEVDLAEEASPNLQKLAVDIVNLIDLYCKSNEGSYRWFLSRDDELSKTRAMAFLDRYKDERKEMLVVLPQLFIDLCESAMQLAEKYLDMPSLVGLVATQSKRLAADEEKYAADPKRVARAHNATAALEKKIGAYLKTYGSAFADVMYSTLIKAGNLNRFLDQARSHNKEITSYLRANSTTRKIGWINEAIFEHNHFLAGQDLMDVAVSQETELWCKKVELSLAKLALIASEDDGCDRKKLIVTKAAQDDAARLVKIQEKMYEHVRPSLYDAVDETAELQLAMEAFGRDTVKGAPKLQQLLEHGMERLVRHSAMGADELIDVLTLMDQRECEIRSYDICGQESLLALEALKHAGLAKERQRFELSLRIIWRRCFLKDDWGSINDTTRKSDMHSMEELEQTTLFKTIYEGFARGVWGGESGVRILSPTDVLGAGTTTQDHSARFSSPDLSEPIAKEMETDDAILKSLVDGYRLEHWFTTTKQVAEKRWKAEGEEKELLAEKLGSTTKAIYEEDADLKRGGENAGIKYPRNWREAVRMGLGMFR